MQHCIDHMLFDIPMEVQIMDKLDWSYAAFIEDVLIPNQHLLATLGLYSSQNVLLMFSLLPYHAN